MQRSPRPRTLVRRAAPVLAALAAVSMTAACGGSSGGGGGGGNKVAVALITKDSTNPFFVAMQKGAKTAAASSGVALSIGAGAKDGDEQGQITLIENAIAGIPRRLDQVGHLRQGTRRRLVDGSGAEGHRARRPELRLHADFDDRWVVDGLAVTKTAPAVASADVGAG